LTKKAKVAEKATIVNHLEKLDRKMADFQDGNMKRVQTMKNLTSTLENCKKDIKFLTKKHGSSKYY